MATVQQTEKPTVTAKTPIKFTVIGSWKKSWCTTHFTPEELYAANYHHGLGTELVWVSFDPTPKWWFSWLPGWPIRSKKMVLDRTLVAKAVLEEVRSGSRWPESFWPWRDKVTLEEIVAALSKIGKLSIEVNHQLVGLLKPPQRKPRPRGYKRIH